MHADHTDHERQVGITKLELLREITMLQLL